MPPLFSITRAILLLRSGPQDIPYSRQLLLSTAAGCVLVQAAAAGLVVDAPIASTLASALLSVAVTLLGLNLLLRIRGLGTRFVQAGIALLLCNLFFTVLGVPFTWLIGDKPLSPEQVTPLQMVLGLMLFPFVIWQVLVNAHILKHALNVPQWVGVLISMLWIVVVAATLQISAT